MKHYFVKSFLFLAVLSVCFGFASCSDDEDDTPPPYEEVWTVQPYKAKDYPILDLNPAFWCWGYVVTDPRGKTGVYGGLSDFDDIWQEGHKYEILVKAVYHNVPEGTVDDIPGYIFYFVKVLSDEVVTDYEEKAWPPYWWPEGEPWPPMGWEDDYDNYPPFWWPEGEPWPSEYWDENFKYWWPSDEDPWPPTGYKGN